MNDIITSIEKFPSISRAVQKRLTQTKKTKKKVGADFADLAQVFQVLQYENAVAVLKARNVSPPLDIKRTAGIFLGTLKSKCLNFRALEVSRFPWSNLRGSLIADVGCGPIMLGQITGTDPNEIKSFLEPIIKKQYPNWCARNPTHGAGTPGNIMRFYFNLFGIYMVPITQRDIQPDLNRREMITSSNVILTTNHTSIDQMSWFARFNKQVYHLWEPITPIQDWPADNYTEQDKYLLYSLDWV